MSVTEPTVSNADPAPPTGPSWRWLALGLIAGIGLTVVGVTLLPSAEPSRQDVVAERGAVVMPFDLEATTHVFDATGSGGIQTVLADDPTNAAQIAFVRGHLVEEAGRFQAGDFGDPATIHGHEMPGLEVLESSVGSLTVSYREVPAGGEITYLSAEPEVVQALHDWFAAQVSDHGEHVSAG
ncbi:MAG: aspartate carbamoyltransferase [Actinomycetota bacterium]